MAYTKLFSSIVTSSIWSEDDKTRIVWITMLAIADRNGEVQAAIPGLARLAGVSIEDTKIAVDKFLSPDPYSRTPDDGGRRIEPIDGGWAILNHAKYRAMASKDEAKTANAERQKRFREKESRNAKRNAIVTHRNDAVTHGRDIAEAEAEAEAFYVEESKDSSPSPTPAIAWSAAAGWTGISERDFESYRIAYPACDPVRQLEAMHQWLLGNPLKAKKKQWRRFVSNWMNRAQEKGGDIASNPSVSGSQVKPRITADREPDGDWRAIWYRDNPDDATKPNGEPYLPTWQWLDYEVRAAIIAELKEKAA